MDIRAQFMNDLVLSEGPWIDVRSCGVWNDDTHASDNVTAISNAINAANGRVIVFPPGIYRIDSLIWIGDLANTTIMGMGDATIKQVTANNRAFYLSSTRVHNKITIKDLKFQGPNTAPLSIPHPGYEVAIDGGALTSKDLLIDNCYFAGFNKHNIRSYIANTIVKNCVFVGYGSFSIADPANRAPIKLQGDGGSAINNTIRDWDYGANCVGADRMTVIGNRFEGPSYSNAAIYLADSEFGVVANNVILLPTEAEGFTGNGYQTIKIDRADGTVIIGNVIRNGDIYIDRMEHCTIVGNCITVETSIGSLPAGINVNGQAGYNCKEILIANNSIINQQTGDALNDGIKVTNSQRVTITGNYIEGVEQYGIWITGSDNTNYSEDIIIRGNTIINWDALDSGSYGAIHFSGYITGKNVIRENVILDNLARTNPPLGILIGTSHTSDMITSMFGNYQKSDDASFFPVTLLGSAVTGLETDEIREVITTTPIASEPGIYSTQVNNNAAALAISLANGTYEGQKKLFKNIAGAGGGDHTITPATFGDGSNITFDAVNEFVELVWTGGSWWVVGTDATVG